MLIRITLGRGKSRGSWAWSSRASKERSPPFPTRRRFARPTEKLDYWGKLSTAIISIRNYLKINIKQISGAKGRGFQEDQRNSKGCTQDWKDHKSVSTKPFIIINLKITIPYPVFQITGGGAAQPGIGLIWKLSWIWQIGRSLSHPEAGDHNRGADNPEWYYWSNREAHSHHVC